MTAGDDGGTAPAAAARLARMLQFGDSMFPIGGFAFSGGLESAIQKRVVTDADTLHAFARTAVEQAAPGDGIALVWAHRAAAAGDVAELVRIDERVYARKLSSETRTMSVRMGKKFAEMGAEVTGAPFLRDVARPHRGRRHPRLLSGGAGGELRRPGPAGARRVRGAPVRRRGDDPERGAAADEDQPRGHAADAVPAQRRRGRRLRDRGPRAPRPTWPASRRSPRSWRRPTSRRTCACS